DTRLTQGGDERIRLRLRDALVDRLADEERRVARVDLVPRGGRSRLRAVAEAGASEVLQLDLLERRRGGAEAQPRGRQICGATEFGNRRDPVTRAGRALAVGAEERREIAAGRSAEDADTLRIDVVADHLVWAPNPAHRGAQVVDLCRERLFF